MLTPLYKHFTKGDYKHKFSNQFRHKATKIRIPVRTGSYPDQDSNSQNEYSLFLG